MDDDMLIALGLAPGDVRAAKQRIAAQVPVCRTTPEIRQRALAQQRALAARGPTPGPTLTFTPVTPVTPPQAPPVPPPQAPAAPPADTPSKAEVFRTQLASHGVGLTPLARRLTQMAGLSGLRHAGAASTPGVEGEDGWSVALKDPRKRPASEASSGRLTPGRRRTDGAPTGVSSPALTVRSATQVRQSAGSPDCRRGRRRQPVHVARDFLHVDRIAPSRD